MVHVSSELPTTDNGSIHIDRWRALLAERHPQLDTTRHTDAATVIAELPNGQKLLERGMTLMELVSSLTLDADALLAALLYRARREQAMDVGAIREQWGDAVADLVDGVEHMGTASLLELSNPAMLASEQQDQVENVKRLLVSLVDDARVAVIKIAERVLVLRQAKHDDETRKQRISREAREVFAPLAGRLGIWQLKWELEDLSMRYLDPETYLDIARRLDGRRVEREAQVRTIAEELQALLADSGIQAEVQGRAKHIYSIWRKMRAKGVDLEEVYDMRAVRILVSDLAACYASLGVVHATYKHVPMEFDDYIAAPKDNGYRSIHTAVIGPDGATLEVQIRTHEMHEEAELGVCAHWNYKGDDSEDGSYGAKMEWLRQVVEWHDAIGGQRSLTEELQDSFQQERIFVYTPGGHVIHLPSNATPIDFAYRVHTDVGHRCTGALVDGVKVPLDHPLATGQRVQILTDRAHEPERRWLEPNPRYVRTTRARSKIQNWFRTRGTDVNLHAGKALLHGACQALALNDPVGEELSELAQTLNAPDAETLLVRIGTGDVQLQAAVRGWCAHFDRAQTQLDLPTADEEPTDYRLVLVGRNRDGLLLDTSQLLSDLGVSLRGLQGRVLVGDRAEITMDFAATSLFAVYRVLTRLSVVDGVETVARAINEE